MTSITEKLKLKQKLHQIPDEDIRTEIGGIEVDPANLISLEEEDLRLQYKHLNIFTS